MQTRRKRMTVTERSVVVGVFQKDAQAEQAIRDLQLAGFRDDQLRISVHGDAPHILEGLTQMGVSPTEADFYNQEFTAGHTVVIVLTTDRQQDALRILQNNQASNAHIIHEHGGNQTIQVREEQLQVSKQWVPAGEVRIRKRVVTENKTFTIPVSREEIVIERYPAQNQPGTVTENSGVPNTGGSIEGTIEDDGKFTQLAVGETVTFFLREEQVHFEKVPMLVEQVTVTKRIIQEMRTIQETVQKEQVTINPVGNVQLHEKKGGDTTDT